MTDVSSTEKRLDRRKEFIRWAINTPGVFNGTPDRLRELMNDSETHVGLAWQAWMAAWRKRS